MNSRQSAREQAMTRSLVQVMSLKAYPGRQRRKRQPNLLTRKSEVMERKVRKE